MKLYTEKSIINTEEAGFYRFENDQHPAFIEYGECFQGHFLNQLRLTKGNIFSNAAGLVAFMDGDEKTASKYRLSLDDLWGLEWYKKGIAQAFDSSVTKKMHEIEERIKAEEHEKKIKYLKDHGLYNQWLEEKKRNHRYIQDQIYKEKMRIRLGKLYRALHKEGFTTDVGFWHEANDSMRVRLTEIATGEYPPSDSKYYGYFTIPQLEEMFGTAEH